jgi:hypothetical protein
LGNIWVALSATCGHAAGGLQTCGLRIWIWQFVRDYAWQLAQDLRLRGLPAVLGQPPQQLICQAPGRSYTWMCLPAGRQVLSTPAIAGGRSAFCGSTAADDGIGSLPD